MKCPNAAPAQPAGRWRAHCFDESKASGFVRPALISMGVTPWASRTRANFQLCLDGHLGLDSTLWLATGFCQASAMVKTEPTLIAQVLSPMTAAHDRGVKFGHYRTPPPSLEEYLLVDLDTRLTDCWRKGADGLWELHPFARGEAAELASVRLTLTTAQLFAAVAQD